MAESELSYPWASVTSVIPQLAVVSYSATKTVRRITTESAGRLRVSELRLRQFVISGYAETGRVLMSSAAVQFRDL